MLQVTSRSSLAKTRRRAKARGFRVLNDGCGCYSVIDTKIEPPRPLVGLDHVPLWVIEQVITTPLPEPPPRRQRMAPRPVEPTPTVDAVTLLRDHGFVPTVGSSGQHVRVRWFDQGRRFTLFIPASPSDHRARLNS